MKINDLFKMAVGLLGVQAALAAPSGASKSRDYSLSSGPLPLTEQDHVTDVKNSNAMLRTVERFLDESYRTRQTHFPPENKYALDSGNPFGLVITDISKVFPTPNHDSKLCSDAGDIGEDLLANMEKMIDIANKQFENEEIPLKLQSKPFTDPSEFYNPKNKPIPANALWPDKDIPIPYIPTASTLSPEGKTSLEHPVWGAQGIISTGECDQIGMDLPPGAYVVADHVNAFNYEKEFTREMLHDPVLFNKNAADEQGLTTIFHEFLGHTISDEHPHQLNMRWNPGSRVAMALLRTMCNPSGELSSSIAYLNECYRKLPEERANVDWNTYKKTKTQDPRLAKIGRVHLWLFKCALNPNICAEDRKKTVDLIFESAKQEWQLAAKGMKVLMETKAQERQQAKEQMEQRGKPKAEKIVEEQTTTEIKHQESSSPAPKMPEEKQTTTAATEGYSPAVILSTLVLLAAGAAVAIDVTRRLNNLQRDNLISQLPEIDSSTLTPEKFKQALRAEHNNRYKDLEAKKIEFKSSEKLGESTEVLPIAKDQNGQVYFRLHKSDPNQQPTQINARVTSVHMNDVKELKRVNSASGHCLLTTSSAKKQEVVAEQATTSKQKHQRKSSSRK